MPIDPPEDPTVQRASGPASPEPPEAGKLELRARQVHDRLTSAEQPELARFLAEVARRLPPGWGASAQLEDPLTRLLEVAGQVGEAEEVLARADLATLTPLPEAFREPPPAAVLERMGADRAEVITLAGERPFGRLLLLARADAKPLARPVLEALEGLAKGHQANLERARSHREDEKFAARLRWVAEAELAERFTSAALGLVPDLVAAVVLRRHGPRLEVVRARRAGGELLEGSLRRTLPWEGSHLEALAAGQGKEMLELTQRDRQGSWERYGEWRLFSSLIAESGARRLEAVSLGRASIEAGSPEGPGSGEASGARTIGGLLLFHGGPARVSGRTPVAESPERQAVERLSRALSLAFDRIRPEGRQASTLLYLQELLGSSGTALAPLLRTVVEEMVRSLGAHAGLLAFVDAHTGRLLLSEVIGYGEAFLPEYLPLDPGGEGRAGLRGEGPESIVLRVVRTGRPYVARDTRSSEVYRTADPSIRSEVAVPLRLRGETFGVALVSSRTPGFFSHEEVGHFQLLADQVAVAVDNARLLDRLQGVREREVAQRQRREFGFDPTVQAADVEYHFGNLVGDPDGPMGEVYAAIERLAGLEDQTVLIVGETGTGKEMVAHAIHSASDRSNRAMVATNFAALGGDPNLIQSELFGHERGAFTGASSRRRGCFETAHRSTLLIDEVGDIIPSVQVKLLRVLGRGSERRFVRLGGEEVLETDVRVLAATNQDLAAEIRAGRFREDLYYRLSALVVPLPPLRQRQGDIPLLVRHILAVHAGKRRVTVSRRVEQALADYPWPGNVRQLESVILRALLLYGLEDRIDPDDVARALEVERGVWSGSEPLATVGAGAVSPQRQPEAAGRGLLPPDPAPPGWFWEEVWQPFKEHRLAAGELRRLIEGTLEETGGFYTRAAERLGVDRGDYQRFLDFLGNADVKVDHRPYRKGGR